MAVSTASLVCVFRSTRILGVAPEPTAQAPDPRDRATDCRMLRVKGL